MCVSLKIMDARGENSLALFPAKFHESMWIRRGTCSNSTLLVYVLCLILLDSVFIVVSDLQEALQ